MYETERRQIPYGTLVTLADHYKVSLDYLLERTDDPEIPDRLSECEKRLIKQFRKIDKRGQEAVLAMLRYEYARTIEKDTPPSR